ncbi:MAG: type II toxin-antitoxin system VapC family toxin [Candidatus Schekmanbacteria bacterium]|nr:type II toxin-antitoxin system VapC family toxin [Candidatus Schekmanbacteria bacterium]
MAYLLDTHTFLWMRHAPDRLGEKAHAVCGEVNSELVMSLASAWEMAIKLSIGKLRLHETLREILVDARTTRGIAPLAIKETHVLRVRELPFHHHDPFDRILAAQALEEGLTLLSADACFDAYAVPRVW